MFSITKNKMRLVAISICTLNVFIVVAAEYDCICSYSIESPVFSSPTEASSSFGYMYEFDCKKRIQDDKLDTTWYAVAYKHQIGYVQSEGVSADRCAGNPSEQDMLTTPSSTRTSTYETTVSSTSQPSSTDPIISSSISTSTDSTSAVYVSMSTTHTNTILHPSSTTTTPPPPTTTTSTTVTTAETAKTSQAVNLTTPTVTTSITPAIVFTPIHNSTSASSSMWTNTMSLATSTHSAIPTFSEGNTHLCQTVHQNHANKQGNFLSQFGEYCYELMSQRKLTWQHGEQLCKSGGGHLVAIDDIEVQSFIEAFLKRHMPDHAIWIGLHDLNTENQFEWTSGVNVSYSNWITGHISNFQSHETEDCVALIPYKEGKWDDIPCGYSGIFGGDTGETHPIICQFKTVSNGATLPVTSFPMGTTSVPNQGLDGNTRLCSSYHQQHAITYNTILGQYGRYCYELMASQKVSWKHGEQLCQASHGHLVNIASVSEQAFVEGFLNRHMPDHAVWIGLHDLNTENQFEWTTGMQVTYVNWIPGHSDNFASHTEEDCVALIPYKGGQWDDIPCGFSGIFGTDGGETHPIICQYNIIGSSLIG